MNVRLLYADRDFDPQAPLPETAAALTDDLELTGVFEAMAAGDKFLLQIAQHSLLASLTDAQAIGYRQRALSDCLRQPAIVRGLYALAVEAIEREKQAWGWVLTRYPEGVLLRSIQALKQLTGMLARLRQMAAEHRSGFASEAFGQLFEMLIRELGDDYLLQIGEHLQRLGFRDGVLLSAALGQGNRGSDYVLRTPPAQKQSWMQRLQGWRERLTAERSSHVYQIADRDEAGLRALSELRSEGIGTVAAVLGRSSDHVLAFFVTLRAELAFYVGCLNLHERLARTAEPTCLPAACAAGTDALSARQLYDLGLFLRTGEHVVGNSLQADGKRLVMITGANRGGKSTFLRALGQAQLMLQAGMFVAAESYAAEACGAVFTHFKREEDPGLRSGKLDEELARMSAIIERLHAGSLIVLNESFASTNEREGSQIAAEVVGALMDAGVRVFYVTHLFDLAQRFYETRAGQSLFLRAERLADGRRTFRLLPGEPVPTSYGEDLYRRIFESDAPPLADAALPADAAQAVNSAQAVDAAPPADAARAADAHAAG